MRLLLRRRLFPALLVIVCGSTLALAQQATPSGARPLTVMPSVLTVPPEPRPSSHFDPEAATNAYLTQIPSEAMARSNAYFEGGYWLILWDFLTGGLALVLVLQLRWSGAMRNIAESITRFKPLQTLIYWAEFSTVIFVLTLPMTIYEGFFREHQYGLATQTFGPWMSDQIKGLLVGIILGGFGLMFLFGVVRRLPNTWWIWGAVVSTVGVAFFALIAPVFVFPLFNNVSLLEDPEVTQPILSMARANGIAADRVYQIDASRQTTRMSANVSGFGRTMRITLNDNLLRRGRPGEIQSIMGHEMGHYVLNHVLQGFHVFFPASLLLPVFAVVRWALEWLSRSDGEAGGRSRGVGDTAVLPLVFLLVFYFFPSFLTPFLTRRFAQKLEADMYGLNAAGSRMGLLRPPSILASTAR